MEKLAGKSRWHDEWVNICMAAEGIDGTLGEVLKACELGALRADEVVVTVGTQAAMTYLQISTTSR